MSEETKDNGGIPVAAPGTMIKVDTPPALPAPVPVAAPEPKAPVMTQADYLAMAQSFGNIETTPEQQGILFAIVGDEDVEIRPDGLIYLPWTGYVRRLRGAFGTSWGLLPQGKPAMRDGFVMWGFFLCVKGKMASYAVGECEQTSRMTYGDCLEGAKSNALMRCCKNIGISLELWEPSFIRRWVEKYAVQDVPDPKHPGKLLWRRRDKPAPPATVTMPGEHVDPPSPVPVEVQLTPAETAPEPVREPLTAPSPHEGLEAAQKRNGVNTAPEPTPPAKDPYANPVPGTEVKRAEVKVEAVNVHKPGKDSRAKNPSYRIIASDKRTYYTFDKTMATIANEAKKSGVIVRIDYEATAYGFKASAVKTGPFDVPLPLQGA